ncbi:MAG: MFS transporter [Actinomycetota bacterium]
MVETTAATGTARVFRGWWVLLGIFIVLTAGSGFAFYAQGVFLDALVEEQGFSVSMAGAGTGTFFVVSGVAGYYAGGLMSRFDIRAVMVAGATVASVGIALLGSIRTEAHMFAVFVVYGGGYAFAGLVPATSLVTRWFHVRRSVALSIASTGLSVGGIAVTPILAQLIDRRSLMEMAPAFAVAYWLGVVPITLLLLRPSPEALGLRPDGAAAVGGEAPAPPGVDVTTAVRTRYFRLQSLAFILVMGAQVGALQHIFKLVKDAIGVDAASLALVVVTLTSVLARLAGGVAASRVPLAPLTSMLIVVQAAGITTIGLGTDRTVILIGVVILGLAMGNLLMLHPLLLADAFGVADYPRIYGLGALLMTVGVGIGPFVVGVLRDTADYRTAFLFTAAVAMVGLVVFRIAGSPDRSWTSPDDDPVAVGAG